MLYFGFIDGREYNQEEISQILNISRSRISRIFSGGLKKIRREIERDNNISKLLGIENYGKEIDCKSRRKVLE